MKVKDISKNKILLAYALKTINPLVILLVLYLVFVFGIIIPTLEKNLYNEKIETTMRLAQLLYSDLASRQEEVEKGIISVEEHKQRVISRYEKLRFGKRNSDYFWIMDERGFVIMHPYVKSIVNVDPKTVTGPDGRLLNILLDKMFDVVQRQNAGMVEYQWQFNDNPDILAQKMSFVQKFEPWDWVIGAGVYIDDIEHDISLWRGRLIVYGLILVFITILINLLISLRSVKAKIEENYALKSLKEREETFSKLFEESYDPVIMLDEGKIVNCNQATLETFGYADKSAMIGKKPEDFSPLRQFNGESTIRQKRKIYHDLLKNSFVRFEWIFKRSNEDTFPADTSISKIIIANKPVLYVILRDISHLVEIQNTLKESKQRLKTILMSIADAVIATDIEGNIIQMNYSAEKITGHNMTDDKPTNICDLLKLKINDSSDFIFTGRESYHSLINSLINLKKCILYSESYQKYYVSVNVSFLKFENNAINGLVYVFRDITEETKLKIEVEETEHLFKTFSDISPYFLIIQRLSDNKYLMVNKAFADYVNLTENDIIDQTPAELGREINEEDRKMFKILKNEGKLDNVIKTSKGKLKNNYILYSSRIVKYKDELCAFTVASDITEIRELQEQLSHAQKMDAIGQLAGGMAHDFNNIIGGMMGIIEMMLVKEYNPEEKIKYLQMLLNSGKRAAELTKKLLVFARKGKIDSSPVDVHRAISEAVALLERTINKKVKIQKDLNSEKYFTIGDYTQLMNVFLNMGINADHAMPDGGVLSYESRFVYLDENYCKNSMFEITKGDYLEIIIQDTGHGIEPDLINRIFEPFFTTKEKGKGTGLGLATVYGTVNQHHGAITVESKVNQGTSFKIYLPVMDAQINYHTNNEEISGGTGTILVVDDEYIIQVMAKAVLENLGYTVMIANNGREAVDIYKYHNEKIDLVIMDMVMPEMNGKECFYELKKINQNVKVILSSGFTEENDLDDLKSSGLSGFIKKPYSTKEISKLISQCW